MKHLIIVGVGGFAREVYGHAFHSLGYGVEWNLKGFLDGDVCLSEDEYQKLDLPLLGDINTYEIQTDDVFICGIGNGLVRKKLVDTIQQKGGEFINVIHKSVEIHPHVKMGIGNVLCYGVFLQEHATIGNFVVLNAYAGLGHDSQAADFSSFMGRAGLCGYAKAGAFACLETGAQVLPHAVVEDYAHIGVGAVVYKKAKQGKTYLGNPALPIF